MRILYTIALLFLAVQARTQSESPVPALSFLRIEPDARGSALGLTGAATTPDNFSLFYNPAKVAMMAGREYGMSVGYVPYLSRIAKGVGLASAEGFRRMSENAALGLDIRFFTLGQVQFKDETGYSVYSYAPTEYAIGLTYSRQLSTYSSIGFTGRYINSRPALGIQYQGAEIRAVNAVSIDVGFYYCNVSTEEQEFGGGILRGGIVLQNLGTKVKYHSAGGAAFQPMNLRAGLSYTFAAEAHDHIFTISADINKLMVPPAAVRDEMGNIISGKDPNEISVPAAFFSGLSDLNSLGVGAGIEYCYNSRFFLRGGAYFEPQQFSSRQLGTVGIGFNLGAFHLDMSYYINLGTSAGSNSQAQTFKISLGVLFDSQ